jgi:multicomponent Na+:H+ antiporter subunit D
VEGFWLPIFVLLSSLLTGLGIFFLGEERHFARTVLNMSAATIKLILVTIMWIGFFAGQTYESRWPILPGIDMVFATDIFGLVFLTLSSGLWFVTTLYAVGYLEETPNRSRFFGFFSLCVSSTMGIAMAGNLFTFLIFYEMLTLSTYPLVIHRGTADSLKAGRTYLIYTLTGGSILLVSIAWLQSLVGPVDFLTGGALQSADISFPTLRIIFFFFIAALGVKAAIVPIHSWLPEAMVAPAPVSALLHAVAVVKAGAFGIVRVVHDVYGINLANELGVLQPLLVIATITIIYGSIQALIQDELKKRLAFSTVSQISYIILGIAIFGPIAMIGGIVHIVHQGLMKITLFFCAGNFAETLGVHKINELNGIGHRMPLTMTAFTVGSLGLIGLPPFAGFITKWYLGSGALLTGEDWVILVLVISSLLNASYFLPIIYRGWFQVQEKPWPIEHHVGPLETNWMLLTPPLITAILVIASGLFAAVSFSPLSVVELIALVEYPP